MYLLILPRLSAPCAPVQACSVSLVFLSFGPCLLEEAVFWEVFWVICVPVSRLGSFGWSLKRGCACGAACLRACVCVCVCVRVRRCTSVRVSTRVRRCACVALGSVSGSLPVSLCLCVSLYVCMCMCVLARVGGTSLSGSACLAVRACARAGARDLWLGHSFLGCIQLAFLPSFLPSFLPRLRAWHPNRPQLGLSST